MTPEAVEAVTKAMIRASIDSVARRRRTYWFRNWNQNVRWGYRRTVWGRTIFTPRWVITRKRPGGAP